MSGDERAPFRNSDVRIALTHAQRLDWLRLFRSENVGPRSFRDLLNFYGSAAAALSALPSLSRRGGKASIRVTSREEAEREMDRADRHGVRLIALGEPDYPALLRQTGSPPPLIGARGDLSALHRPMIAFVGSRNASHAGLRMAEILAREAGEAGYVTVSGLARGVDAAIHRASLETGTIAVLAGGHDQIYPTENEGLAEAVAKTGALVSEMPMGHGPRAKDFPRRNRIIAGLALATVVVEAADGSGSLITARMALDENREVMAVPGSPLDPRAAGPNRLIRQGAALVTRFADVEAALGVGGMGGIDRQARLDIEEPDAIAPAGREPDADDRATLISLLSPSPAPIDELIRLAGLPPGVARVALLELELAGRVRRDGADRFALALD